MIFQRQTGKAYEREYGERLQFLFDLFDGRPFRLPPDERGRERLSAAMYDASMVAIDGLWEQRDEIRGEKEELLRRLAVAMEKEDKIELLTGQKNTAQAVRDRIALMRAILRPAEST